MDIIMSHQNQKRNSMDHYMLFYTSRNSDIKRKVREFKVSRIQRVGHIKSTGPMRDNVADAVVQ